MQKVNLSRLPLLGTDPKGANTAHLWIDVKKEILALLNIFYLIYHIHITHSMGTISVNAFYAINGAYS